MADPWQRDPRVTQQKTLGEFVTASPEEREAMFTRGAPSMDEALRALESGLPLDTPLSTWSLGEGRYGLPAWAKKTPEATAAYSYHPDMAFNAMKGALGGDMPWDKASYRSAQDQARGLGIVMPARDRAKKDFEDSSFFVMGRK